MSKVIYLDGTETLVLTREMVLGRRDNRHCPLRDWEITVMMMIAHAARFPGAAIIGEYNPNESPHRGQMVELVTGLMRTRMIFMREGQYLFRVYDTEMVLRFYDRGGPNDNELIRIDLGWNSFP
ncbi:hypothetical protein HYP93_gp30 [Stenotrophomonas phage Pokken]|uniref:Uncharacterized protein n=1 Tax=Stenotrophomonas phage Pokken TaxID=2596674 RepID=A0A5B9NEN4_9CAUD|nr:hypothetical protein HYP93_gp30 [Stenotrophomonas phage Pokken]QEG09253.1 hypothetical protein CPT_Pokken_030 [Stenotrophomonas phage Pokken]